MKFNKPCMHAITDLRWKYIYIYLLIWLKHIGRRDRSVTMNVESERKDEQEVKGWRKALKSVGNWLAHKDKDEWLKDMRGVLSLVSTVIATMTFQSALNPLGEVRPGNESGVVQCPVNKADNNPCPGESILAVVYPDEYEPHLEHNMFHFIFSSVSLACKWVPSQSQILHLAFVNRDVHHHLQPHSYLHDWCGNGHPGSPLEYNQLHV